MMASKHCASQDGIASELNRAHKLFRATVYLEERIFALRLKTWVEGG